MNIIEEVKDIFPEILNFRRHLHKNPELSFQEYNTAEFIREKLTSWGIEYKIYSNTGTAALIGKGDKCIALRADIDALPIFEETDLEFKSINDGIMHACGHDMHTSMLLGVAKILKNHENDLNCQIKLIFQLGEELLPGGASLMIKEGVLENPKVDAIFGQHIYPDELSGVISTISGPIMASADELYIDFKGKSTHAAQPHLGFDPLLAASSFIVQVQTLLTKFKDPMKSGVISITAINGGHATNIIPDEVKLKGTFRAFDDNWRFDTLNRIEKLATNIADIYGCEAISNIKVGYPPVINEISTTEVVKNSALELFGSDNFKEFEPKMWGEDFAFYGKEIPACFWFLGVKPNPEKQMPALHNSKLNPDENAMLNGIAMMLNIALNYK